MPTTDRKNKPYTYKEQPLSEQEQDFWKQYGIMADTLIHYKVCSLREYQSETAEGKPFCLVSSPTEPIFGYKNKRFVKSYRPFSQIRFMYGGTLGDNYCFGLEQLPAKGDTVFITGGEKDVMSLAARGLHAICFNSETVNIPTNIIYKLTFRFKHIVLLYDTDKTGMESSKKHEKQLSEYGVKRLLLPLAGTKEEKDVSDYFRMGNSRADFMKLFLEVIQKRD